MSLKLPKFSFLVICRSIIVLWLLVLSVLAFSNLNLTTQILNNETNSQQNLQLQVLETQLVQLSEFMADQNIDSQQNPYITQTQFSDMQAELRERITAISDQPTMTDLQGLQTQLEEQREVIQKLQEQLAAKPPAQVNSTTRQPRAVTPTPQKTSVVAQPFKVLAVELRGGERFLSVMPAGRDGIASITLLGIGQQIGSWKLESIEGNTAVFKVGAHVRRVALPNQ